MENSNNQNNSNKSSKNPFARLIVILLSFFIASFIFQELFLSFEQSPEPIPESTESITESTSPSYPEDPSKMIGNMEFIGCTRDAIVTSPVAFYYYRDIVTDQMFLVSHNTDNHTVTPLANPKTGLPLTYFEYQKLQSAKIS